MTGSALLMLTLWATHSLCTVANTNQHGPKPVSNGTRTNNNHQSTTEQSEFSVGRSFYLTADHRMKGDVSSDLEGFLYRHLGDYPVDSPQQCTLICLSNPQCRSVSYKKSKWPRCHLHDIMVDDYVMLIKDPDWDIFSTYDDPSKNWTLVFFSLAGSGRPPYQIFTSPETGIWKEKSCSSVECIGAFKSSFIEHWSTLPVAKVKFVLSKAATQVVVLEFDGEGSDKMNWFSRKRLLNAKPWNDIFTEKQNFFSIEGEGKIYMRRFYINKGYGSCKNDIGWLIIRDDEFGAVCDTQPQIYPQFMYSPAKKYQKRPDYDLADKMEIFVNLK